MKRYLVAYSVGGGKLETHAVDTKDDYTPASDDMLALKKAIVKYRNPVWHFARADSDSCGGSVKIYDTNKPIGHLDLEIVAVSRLDI